MLKQQPAVIVKDLYKSFKLPHEQHKGFKELVVDIFKRKKGYTVQEVLNDISFEIEAGEFFGIVGRNGSGKSTLLKLLASTYTPDSGMVQTNGSLTPFIELGVGFNPELTGRENIFMNGALLGFSRKEMEVMYDDIVDFAELPTFMDQKLKNYSSGMQVRLAFSIAIRAKSDILLLDEVLAVGDEAFQQKCYNYFEQLKEDKKTVILVTHDMSSIERFCNRAMLIEKGDIVKIGTNLEIAQLYRELFIQDNRKSLHKAEYDNLSSSYNEVVAGIEVNTFQKNIRTKHIKKHVSFRFEVEINANENIDNAVCILNVNNSYRQLIMKASSDIDESTWSIKKGKNVIEFEIYDNVLTDDDYSLDIIIDKIDKNGNSHAQFQAGDIYSFFVGDVSRVDKHSARAMVEPKINVNMRH